MIKEVFILLSDEQPLSQVVQNGEEWSVGIPTFDTYEDAVEATKSFPEDMNLTVGHTTLEEIEDFVERLSTVIRGQFSDTIN